MKRIVMQNRRWLAELLHAALVALALVCGFLLRFEFVLEPVYRGMLLAGLPLAVAAKVATFRGFGLRHLAWRYIGFADLMRITLANACASAVSAVVLRAVVGSSFPRSIYAIDMLVCFAFLVGARACVKLMFDRRPAPSARRILIYGAGKAGVMVLSEIHANPASGFTVAGFLDDDPSKHHMQIHGVRVLGGRRELSLVVRKQHAEQVLIALPRATGAELTAILEACHDAGVDARRVPALTELIADRVLVDQVREVRLEDLLGRPPVILEEDAVRARLAGRVVMVTGAAGSIGSELCRQIARYGPQALVGFDQAETPLYHLQQELLETFPNVPFYPQIGSVQNRRCLTEVFETERPHLVFHAAAYKHVPMMESHIFEAVENNVFGTANVARCAAAAGVEDFILVSSDKAVRPTNVMGATKRLAEMVCLAANGPRTNTRFAAVRFGNVLGSNGSVIPRFRQQIAQGGPITVTHPDMRRFFMTIPEAAQLVLQAATMGKGGEIFVLEMGEPVKIIDLARKMVLLSGLRPDRDIQIVFSGIRPGEKLYEELSAMEEDTMPTPHSQIRIFSGPRISEPSIQWALRELRRSTVSRQASGVLMCLKDAVADYNPSSTVLRRAFARNPHGARMRGIAATPIA